MTDTTSGAESVTLSEHLSASPLFKEFCTAIFSFLCSFFLLIIVCLSENGLMGNTTSRMD
jgi:hypothetical protein